MDTIHKISNITSERILDTFTEGDETFSLYELKCDRAYEDGSIDKNTTVICNQSEYEQIKAHGYYLVLDSNNHPDKITRTQEENENKQEEEFHFTPFLFKHISNYMKEYLKISKKLYENVDDGSFYSSLQQLKQSVDRILEEEFNNDFIQTVPILNYHDLYLILTDLLESAVDFYEQKKQYYSLLRFFSLHDEEMCELFKDVSPEKFTKTGMLFNVIRVLFDDTKKTNLFLYTVDDIEEELNFYIFWELLSLKETPYEFLEECFNTLAIIAPESESIILWNKYKENVPDYKEYLTTIFKKVSKNFYFVSNRRKISLKELDNSEQTN